nr:MAG TPA: hypothetical protein [Caudoviricetes sp.]
MTHLSLLSFVKSFFLPLGKYFFPILLPPNN